MPPTLAPADLPPVSPQPARGGEGHIGALAASAFLHALVVAAMLHGALPAVEPAAENAIEVEIVRAPMPEAAPALPAAPAPRSLPVMPIPPAPAAPLEPPRRDPGPAPAPEPGPAFVQSRRALSAAILRDPRSRSVARLGEEERIEQLCDLEGMAQICALTGNLKQVASFAFLVGAEIPRSAWAQYGLPAESGGGD